MNRNEIKKRNINNKQQTTTGNNKNINNNQNLNNSNNNNNNNNESTTVSWAKDFMNWNDGNLERERTQLQQQKDRCFKVLKKSTIACILLLFISCTLIYAMTQYPSVSGGDAGELIIVAHQMGVGHPPGYPLFTFLGYLVSHLFPSNNFSVAWKVSFMSSMVGSLASIFIYLTVYLWVNNHWCGLLSAYMFTFSPLIWMYQIQGEVFSLNNMFTAMLLFLGVWYTRVRIFENERYNTAFWTSERIAYLCAFSCALGLTNQHTLVLVVVPFAFWLMFIAGRDQLWNMRIITNLVFYTLFGLSPYLLLIILPKLNRVKYSWGNTATLRGFMKHFLREEYGTLQLYGGDGGSISLFVKIYTYFENLILQFNYIGLVLILIGILNLLLGYNLRTFKWKSFGTMIIFSFLFYITFFFNLCNLPIEKPLYKGVFFRFFMQPNVFLSVAMGLGLRTVFQKGSEKLRKYLLPIVAIGISIYQIQSNYYLQDQSNNYSFYDYGHAILDTLPRNTLLLVGGDLCTNVPMYLNLVEKVRPDVDIVSMEIMSWEWFKVTQAPLFNRIIFPGEVYHPYVQGGYSLKAFLDSNIRNRPIYLAGDFKSGDNSFQKDYFTISKGLTAQIIPVKDSENYNVYKIIKNTLKHFPTFDLPTDIVKYPEDSWEYFLVGEMVVNLERASENLFKTYLNQESKESLQALELTLEILLKSLKLQEDRCWSLKHIGISYDHLRYRILKDNNNATNQKQAEYYSTQLLHYWKKYINQCYNDRDGDWDTIKNVIQHMSN
ncbi:hypothetical protein DICPUDRAFT_52381 [Dictyostelium purpureum]|uniref:DUF2723 domain-containing protein n=1 Tax=Dictyostelium purpureum TaxID=5786 RepID=F0Z838_DICPU|nr:uncharacterized protein DICPUDRAFT_52381 [Dictyostelium purpureum]EGC39829.1 hypothetical protein DICPUDRAFT_52381 [Dictyostelium purpureum]|eukprot:XP_003283580.1 hypothetical protein DICPUDRAFT_52381 [Dictyostelium purpureum]